MNPQDTQSSSPQDPTQKANNAAASLAFATHLQTQLMQHQAPPMASQEPHNATGQESDEETMNDEEKKPELAEELTKFKTEIEGMMDSKLGDLKREIEVALSDEQEE